MLGTSPIDPSTNLLSILDDATSIHGCVFNNAVTRKALKSLVTQDFHLSDWNRLATDTLSIIEERFIEDAGDGVTSHDFYIILATQTFQKLIKASHQKSKQKEHIF